MDGGRGLSYAPSELGTVILAVNGMGYITRTVHSHSGAGKQWDAESEVNTVTRM